MVPYSIRYLGPNFNEGNLNQNIIHPCRKKHLFCRNIGISVVEYHEIFEKNKNNIKAIWKTISEIICKSSN